jgi:sporulation protein YlmC with PRC-barrel domain
MRLSDLLETPVVDQDGRSWGQVHDAQLVQDGPLLASQQAAFRLHGLVAGRAAFGTRLGYAERDGHEEGQTRGPWPVKALVVLLHRHAVYIPWHAVVAVEPGRVRVQAPPGGFRRVGDSTAPTDPAKG